MKDPRLQQFAKQLVTYSCSVKPGEKVLIEDKGIAPEFTTALVEEIYAAGAIPAVILYHPEVERALMMGYTKEQLEWMAKLDAQRMADCQAYISIRGGNNAFETADVPQEKKALYGLHYGKPVHSDIRVPHTKWAVMRYPTSAMAQQAGMSTAAFEDYYFRVCLMDYAKMSQEMDNLVSLMMRTDKVRITGPGTDLSFSIKGQPAIKCDGKLNIPDGEVFTAPLRESVNGTLSYNTPSLYQGTTFENIAFTFENGKIVKATANHEELLNKILDTDEGARFIGEFAIGVNPHITVPMKDTLFDEKIAGSFHFTPGQCYDDCPNDNHSTIHWDLVCIQTKEWGGGNMYFDDVLVRRDGLFVLPELAGLNPENLM